MKINLFTIRHLLLVILAGFCTNVFAADHPKDDLWELAQKLLDERIRQNTLLIAQGRQDEANYVIDMHKLLLGDSKRFIPATLESSLQRELGDVFLGGNKTDVAGRIQPYLIIMLPSFQEAEYLEQGDEVQPLKVDSSSYALGLRNTHQNSLIATLVITGYIKVTPAPPRGVYTPVAGATRALNEKLGFNMFTRWTSVPAVTRQETTDAFVTEATTRFITILEGPSTPPPSPFEVTCDITIEQLAAQTQAIRESEYESTITGFKELLQNASAKVNGSDYMFADQDLAFVKDDLFTGQVIPDKLATLADNHSEYKMYVVFKEVNFAMSGTDWATFAERVYGASSLAGGNNILLIVPYQMLDIGCTRTNRWLGQRVNEKTAVTMPVVYCSNANVKNAMNLALGTATEWKDGFLNAFTKVPKDHIVYSYYFRVDGKVLNVVSRSEGQANSASIVEFNFWYDKEALESLCRSIYNPNIAGQNTNGVVNNWVSNRQNFQQEIKRLLQSPNPQLHEHNLKEQYIEAEHKRYIDWYLHTRYAGYFDTPPAVYQPAPSIAFFVERQDPVLIAIDLASIGLSFWGLDGIADAAGAMYCTYKGDYINAAIYGASVTVVFVSAVVVKNFINGADVALDGERVIVKSLEEAGAATARWASKGYHKIEDWLAVIDDPNVRNRIETILSQWDNTQDAAVLTKIDNVLGDSKYFGIADEFVNTPELLVYLQRAEQYEWAKFGLAAIIKRDPGGTIHPVKSSPKFSAVINDYEVPENAINTRLSALDYIDETRPGDLGKLFDDWMDRTIREAWDANDFSGLPAGVRSRLETLKRNHVMIRQAKVSMEGFRPVPDLLFIPKKTIGGVEALDFTQCIYIDNKILWDTDFTAAQKKITDNITANAGVSVRYTETIIVEELFTVERNTMLTIVKVESFSVNEAIDLVNLPKYP